MSLKLFRNVELAYICMCFRLLTLSIDTSCVELLVSSSMAYYGNVFMTYWEHACFGWQYAKVSKLCLWQAAVCPCGSLYFIHCLKNFRVKTNQQTPQPYWTTTNTHILFATAHQHPAQCCLRAPIENCHQSEALVMTFARRREKTHCSPEKDDREREREVEKVKDAEWGEGEKQGNQRSG